MLVLCWVIVFVAGFLVPLSRKGDRVVYFNCVVTLYILYVFGTVLLVGLWSQSGKSSSVRESNQTSGVR